MLLETVNILDGNEFLVSNRQGDVEATPAQNHGLFLDDTRFLSRWVLTINGVRPALLSVDDNTYYRVQHFLALAAGVVYLDSHLTVIRQRSVGGGLHEVLYLFNHRTEPVEVLVRIEVAADFADLFEVKDQTQRKRQIDCRIDAEHRLKIKYRRDRHFLRETWVRSSAPAEMTDDSLTFRIKVAAQSPWSTSLEVLAVTHLEVGAPPPAIKHRGDLELRSDLADNLARWVDSAPKLNTSWQPLEQIYQRSLIDLAALRIRTGLLPGALPAAGLPWFMAIFGRDSLLTSLQTVPFVPELAATTLRTLALLQSRADDPFRDAEPGKIPHELRLGERTAFQESPHSPYYGTADATPLFLVLLDEYHRWTVDDALVRSLEREARSAIDWIDHYGDRDGDGYIEYQRRSPKGLENQCWKDSSDSIAFADGALAATPIGTCELQGYAYDAKRRTARLARDVWKDPSWADTLDAQTAELKRRFNQDFWLPERKFFALGLDRDKRKIDSLTSNIGHLLWSGIVDDDKAADCVTHLMGDELFSGWGVRTMAKTERAFNPIGYHVGTVWPHDNSFIAWGLRRYCFRD
jgi:glycogen debranching enzyme